MKFLQEFYLQHKWPFIILYHFILRKLFIPKLDISMVIFFSYNINVSLTSINKLFILGRHFALHPNVRNVVPFWTWVKCVFIWVACYQVHQCLILLRSLALMIQNLTQQTKTTYEYYQSQSRKF